MYPALHRLEQQGFPLGFFCYSRAPKTLRPWGLHLVRMGLGRLELPTSRLSGIDPKPRMGAFCASNQRKP